MWCGIYNGRMVRPYFIDGNLTGKKYTECVLKGVVFEFASELPLAALQKKMWFQHDGAPSHFSLPARKFIDESYPKLGVAEPQHGRLGHPICPPWTSLSENILKMRFSKWNQPIVRISLDNIPRQTLLSTMNSMKQHLRLCIAMDGKQYEHTM